MAKFLISKIKPPYIKGRVHVFHPTKKCSISDVVFEVDSTEPKKTSIVVVHPEKFDTVDGKGNPAKSRSVVTTNKKFDVEADQKVHFMLDDYPMNINYITVSYTVGS